MKAEITRVESDLTAKGGYLAKAEANTRDAEAAKNEIENVEIPERTNTKKRLQEDLKLAIMRMSQRCSLANWAKYKSERAESLYR